MSGIIRIDSSLCAAKCKEGQCHVCDYRTEVPTGNLPDFDQAIEQGAPNFGLMSQAFIEAGKNPEQLLS